MNSFQGSNRKPLPFSQKEEVCAARDLRKEATARLLAAHKKKPQQRQKLQSSETPSKKEPTAPQTTSAAVKPEAPKFGEAQVCVYRDGENEASLPSQALVELVNMYLDVAQQRNRQIAMVWPVAPRELLIVHALATLERWKAGDKSGVRSVFFPTKSNVFFPLNHLQLDRQQVLRLTRQLIHLPPYAPSEIPVRREHPGKDKFLLWLHEATQGMTERLNPSIGDLLPHYYASVGFTRWESCSSHLLQYMSTRIRRHAKKMVLRADCADIGDPDIAPDAVFALDGRMTKEDQKKALQKLAKCGSPEIILVNATRTVRMGGYGWDKAIVRFCALVNEVFIAEKRPGILIVTDAPPAAFQLREQLKDAFEKRNLWQGPQDFHVYGLCNGAHKDGLLEPGTAQPMHPSPRTLDTEIVDTEANRVIKQLYRLAAAVTQAHGRDVARPILEAGNYISRMSALPCGVGGLTEWLSLPTTSEQVRRSYDWLSHSAALKMFANSAQAGEHKASLLECTKEASALNSHYQVATPFALRMAALVNRYVVNEKKSVAIVYTSAIHRRLSEKFLREFGDYPVGVSYETIAEHIQYLMVDELENCFDRLKHWQLIFSGLDDNGLRLLMLDDRIEKHTCVLLTTRSGQYLKATLQPLLDDKNFPAFKSLKPRIESLLKKLLKLPDDKSIMSLGDFALPTFRRELATDAVGEHIAATDPEACRIVLEGGQVLLRRASHVAYVYDPFNEDATDAGFRTATIQALKPGDRLFVMSAELRELVESSLKAAGVPISHDLSFEDALREYHQQIDLRVNEHFYGFNKSDRVNRLRNHMLQKLRETEKTQIAETFPEAQAVSHWIDTKDSVDKPFATLRPQAPQKEVYFSCFMDALGFSKLQAAYYWQRVIAPIRNARRLDGRNVSDIYAYMLMQPESAMLNGNIPRAILQLLFSKARDNVHSIDSIDIPKETGNDE